MRQLLWVVTLSLSPVFVSNVTVVTECLGVQDNQTHLLIKIVIGSDGCIPAIPSIRLRCCKFRCRKSHRIYARDNPAGKAHNASPSPGSYTVGAAPRFVADKLSDHAFFFLLRCSRRSSLRQDVQNQACTGALIALHGVKYLPAALMARYCGVICMVKLQAVQRRQCVGRQWPHLSV